LPFAVLSVSTTLRGLAAAPSALSSASFERQWEITTSSDFLQEKNHRLAKQSILPAAAWMASSASRTLAVLAMTTEVLHHCERSKAIHDDGTWIASALCASQ